ncbi:putative phosphothreonine lyase domain-containg protein [Streptomyces lydicamycinicus]|uniref:putative phosphothreonine lyase domain-containing protein n=1 Tax=Streptomyces lydicamycinicus TaxID=1546107 RepID=UPI003C30A37B
MEAFDALLSDLVPTDRRAPSQVLDEHWIWAFTPTGYESVPTKWFGKWLLFPPLSLLDSSWGTIRTAIEDGQLDYGAKVGTLGHTMEGTDPTRRPICVYTRDWRNTAEVHRTLTVLRDLGFKESLSYKTDEDTRRGRYGKGASTYRAAAASQHLIIPRRTREILDYFHAGREQARRAANARLTCKRSARQR